MKCSLLNITRVTGDLILKHAETLYHFKDYNGLKHLLPYLVNNIDFLATDIIAKVVRVYFRYSKDDVTWDKLCMKVDERVHVDCNVANLDDLLTCALACKVHITPSKKLGLLERFLLEAINGKILTLKCIVTALRLYIATGSSQSSVYDDIDPCHFVHVSTNAIAAVLDCHYSTNITPASFKDSQDLVRAIYLASKLCSLHGCIDSKLPKLLYSSWRLISRDGITLKNALYMLGCVKVLGMESNTLASEVSQGIVSQSSGATLADVRLLIRFMNSNILQSIYPLYFIFVRQLDSNDLVQFLSFLSRCRRLLQPSGCTNLLPVYNEMKSTVCEHFLNLCESIGPKECCKAFAYMATLDFADAAVQSAFFKRLNSIGLYARTVDICNCFYALSKVDKLVPQRFLNTWTSIIEQDVQYIDASSLVKCASYAIKHRKECPRLYQTIIKLFEHKIDSLNPQQLIATSAILSGYTRQPLVSLLHTRNFAAFESMDINGKCIVYHSFSKSGIQSSEIRYKFEHLLAKDLEKMSTSQVSTLLESKPSSDFKSKIYSCATISTIDAFIHFNEDIDTSKLSNLQVLRAALALGSKRRDATTDRIARELYVRLHGIIPLVSKRTILDLFTCIEKYGYSKPKIQRLLTNLSTPNAKKTSGAVVPRGSYCIFRDVCKGPPHLKDHFLHLR